MDVKEIIETVFAGLSLLLVIGCGIWFFASYLKTDMQRCKKVDEARIEFYNSVSSFLNDGVVLGVKDDGYTENNFRLLKKESSCKEDHGD